MTKLFEVVPKVVLFELNFGNWTQNILYKLRHNATCKQDPKSRRQNQKLFVIFDNLLLKETKNVHF